jgi:hypothetical protein
MHQHAVSIPLPDRAEAATTLRRGRELHFAPIPGSSPGQALVTSVKLV